MKSEYKMFLLIIFVFIGTFLFMWYGVGLGDLHNKQMTTQSKCWDYGLGEKEPCSFNSVLCYEDCQKLGKKYFEFDSTGFSSSECWCEDNNESVKIW